MEAEALHKENTKYTYADYCTWDDEQRYELINGEVYAMSPAPKFVHQDIISKLNTKLFNFLKDRDCKVIPAPLDVRLNADGDDDTVVQPDIVVICDRSKITEEGCVGSPEMVIEVTSKSTARRDKTTKFDLYKKYGVKEYWIVDPEINTVSVHLLKDGEYVIRAYSDTDTVPVTVLEGCMIDLSEVFDES